MTQCLLYLLGNSSFTVTFLRFICDAEYSRRHVFVILLFGSIEFSKCARYDHHFTRHRTCLQVLEIINKAAISIFEAAAL